LGLSRGFAGTGQKEILPGGGALVFDARSCRPGPESSLRQRLCLRANFVSEFAGRSQAYAGTGPLRDPW
jgi:hypothetical protein